MTPKQPFLETLYHLRTVEHIILYNKIEKVPASEEKAVMDFLESEYERESADYPFRAPAFNPQAALWGAKTLYFAAQLFLYRENKVGELAAIVPAWPGVADAGVMLSADLCLRFLPAIRYALENVDVNDPLIALLERYLQTFHYSAISREVEPATPDMAVVFGNPCLKQLYLDRITERRVARWGEMPLVAPAILANLGNHKNVLWREFNISNEQ